MRIFEGGSPFQMHHTMNPWWYWDDGKNWRGPYRWRWQAHIGRLCIPWPAVAVAASIGFSAGYLVHFIWSYCNV